MPETCILHWARFRIAEARLGHAGRACHIFCEELREESSMDSNDRRTAGYVLFLLGGLTGTFFALRASRKGSGLSLSGVRRMLDETVEGVESAAGYVRRLVRPVHGILQ